MTPKHCERIPIEHIWGKHLPGSPGSGRDLGLRVDRFCNVPGDENRHVRSRWTKSKTVSNRAQLVSRRKERLGLVSKGVRWSLINIASRGCKIAYQQLDKRYLAISPLEIRPIEYMYLPNPRGGENCSHSEKWR